VLLAQPSKGQVVGNQALVREKAIFGRMQATGFVINKTSFARQILLWTQSQKTANVMQEW